MMCVRYSIMVLCLHDQLYSTCNVLGLCKDFDTTISYFCFHDCFQNFITEQIKAMMAIQEQNHSSSRLMYDYGEDNILTRPYSENSGVCMVV